jgi:membrane associated rhomboid family serine protease
MNDFFYVHPQDPNLPEGSDDQRPGPMFDDPLVISVLGGMVIAYLLTWVLNFVSVALHLTELNRLSFALWNFGICDARVFHGELWRLVTNLFLHAGFGHIFGNMIVMVPLVALMRSWTKGSWWLAIFIVTGICGSLLQLTFHTHEGLVGASGGIAGLGGAAVVCGWRLIASGRKMAVAAPVLVVLVVLIYLQFVSGLSGQATHIAQLAHLGGFLSGLFMARRLPLR